MNKNSFLLIYIFLSCASEGCALIFSENLLPVSGSEIVGT